MTTGQAMSSAMREMPKYQCHKQVWALKIAAIEAEREGAKITPADDGYAPFEVDEDWFQGFHRVRTGDDTDLGYYVLYEDGYASWSPTKAFEEGYTRLERKEDFPGPEKLG